MSTLLSCQELSFVGGQHYDCPSSDPTVDVSTGTLVSLWDAGPHDNAPRPEPGVACDPAWSDHLSPHLQRNKQLQDTLMQREEELARLHEENCKLREFLNSSFVKSLEEKRKKLLSAPSRHRKRVFQGDGEFQTLSQLLGAGEGKRACRNLSLEFCSAEELASAPPLDSWILETLGLKDQDTIDPESSYSSPTNDDSRLSFSSTTSGFSPGNKPTAIYNSGVMDIPTSYSLSAESTCDFSSVMNSNIYHHGLDTPGSCSTSVNSSSEFSSTIDMASLYSDCPTGLSLPGLKKSLHSPADGLVPVATSTPNCSPEVPYQGSPSPPGGSRVLCSTPQSRTDLAFSMSLSPRSSVRTHSFPQGQAFVRKDAQGGWNFTWVPKQCS
ncbi:geminin coiled-coil domain-containing protein 1 isoform X2 [Denticeps clupeoides]|uniref:Geminin coiled-coil domain-containing protein 1 n=1 Tax=Denticeps clupeoides TaxID=299321 RepID=A0AAY4C6G1_9TELE|nr:geminin coiled-coil domain-containing protein 1 isoform X2 [Denticeps clupeoides]